MSVYTIAQASVDDQETLDEYVAAAMPTLQAHQAKILAFDEFEKVQEELQNFEDLKELREAKEKEGALKGLSLSQAKEQLHI